jgi:hypothetical protein
LDERFVEGEARAINVAKGQTATKNMEEIKANYS